MTDIEREMASGGHGAAPPPPPPPPSPAQSPADRRANIGDYLLAMSHEIRAPLNAVIGMSGMLLDGDLGEKNRPYAKSVHSAGESLAAILNDLLDLSRVTAGRLVVEPIPFDLKSTIEETASVLSPRANDRGLALRVDWRPELPRHVIGDPGRTRQVLGNLIGHAVNATSHGEVVIRVLPDGERAGIPAVRFVVEDTGIGIMPERLARVFDDYVPVDASPYRSFGVTGLGLRLSADLVRRMGGEIGAESEPGKGSRFWFVLPMASAEPVAIPAVDGGNRRGGRALVVEADLAARGRYIDQIEAAGWEIEFIDNIARVAETLREAALTGDSFDACFISDYAVRPLHMELAVKLKADLPLAKTALVMVTAVGSPGEGKKVWHAGFAAYIRKPVPNEEMREALAALGNLGPEGRGSSLITRHSLAEARNAQAFAPDGIDEMLASLTPTTEPTNAEPVTEAPAAEEPPTPAPTIWYVPVFAAAPQLDPATAGPIPEERTDPVALLEPPLSPVVEEPIPEEEIADEATEPENRRDPASSEPTLVDTAALTWDRPEEFDPTVAEIDPAEGLDRVDDTLDSLPAQVDGFVGNDFAAPKLGAIVEPFDHVPTGAPLDVDEITADGAETEIQAEEADEDESTISPPEDPAETPIEAAIVEIIDTGEAVASTSGVVAETPVEPVVEAAQPPTDDAGRPLLDVVSALILDQLAHGGGGGFFTQYLVTTFVREVPAAVAELATATNRGDAGRIRSAIGNVRVASDSVGAAKMAEICDWIEAAVDRDQLDEATPLIGTIEQAFVEVRDALEAATTTGLPSEIPAVGAAFLEQVGPGREGPTKSLAIRLIDSFSNDASARILELREVVARGDAEQAQRLAQTVKGMCGLISAEPLAKLCALVEADARLKRIAQADRYLDHLDREFERVRQILAAARG